MEEQDKQQVQEKVAGTILLIDHDPTALEPVMASLRTCDYRVISTASTIEGLSLLETEEVVDLILAEMQPADPSIHRFFMHIQADRRLRRIPLVVSLATGSEKAVLQALSKGARDVVVKPIDPQLVVQRVSKLISGTPGPVLIVDRDAAIRELLAKIVLREGFHAVGAENAEEALEVVNSRRVGLVITDVTLPTLSGLELLTSVKEKHPKLPVVLVTKSKGVAAQEAAISAGADGFIERPFNNTEIAHKVGSLLDI